MIQSIMCLSDPSAAPIIDFTAYVRVRLEEQIAVQTAFAAEKAQQARLEQFLTTMLADLEAA